MTIPNLTSLRRGLTGVRIPRGSVLRVPHGGKPVFRALAAIAQPAAEENDPVKVLKRRTLLEKAKKLGLKEATANGHTWSLERLEGAVFDRFVLWSDAKRAGVRGTNRRWSDSALYNAMLRLKVLGHQ